MDQALDAVWQFAGKLDDVGRKRLITALRDMSYALEDEDDIVHRVGYLPLQTAAVRTAIDLKLFQKLVEVDKSLSVDEASQSTGASPVFMGRLLRYLASVGFIEEIHENEFASNGQSKILAIPGNQAGICHMFDTCGPLYLEMPRFMRKTEWADVTDGYKTVWQDTFDTSENPFQWFSSHPENLRFFNDYMAYRRRGDDSWLSVYPVEEETKHWDPESPVYVNIGGSIGHQCAQFKKKHPNVPGRVILQDLAPTIENALQTPGVENMVQDFMQPQQVKAAKYYYLRAVLHDHADDTCRVILENTKAAMSKESVILVDEMVLPDRGVYPMPASVDLTMMCALGARERTRSQWEELFRSVGLKIVKSIAYKPSACETIMALVPEDRD